MRLYTIFTPDLAADLILQGFELIRKEPSRKNPEKIVYIFENTLEFQLALKKLLKK